MWFLSLSVSDVTSEVPALPGLADLSLLGRGGLADVYLARQQHLERWVAAKVFRVTLADDQAAERFRAECRAIGRLDQYPHVLTVYDAGVLGDGRPYLISERCDGSLHDLVGMRGPLPQDRVAALGSTIGRALRFAHSAGVLHGDVTPQNLLLRTSGAPVLADFGLAVLRDHAPTAAGFTLLHAAPEALRSGAVIDERADVYGLGSTLYTVLTGTPPFPQLPGEDGAAYRARAREEPAPRPDGVTDQMAGLLTAMLATDPAYRPSTDEVITALETSPGRGTRPARPGGTLAATSPQPDPPSAEPVAVPVRPARTRMSRAKKRAAPAPRPWDTRVTRTATATRTGGSVPRRGADAPVAGPDPVRGEESPVQAPLPRTAGSWEQDGTARGVSVAGSAPLPRSAAPAEHLPDGDPAAPAADATPDAQVTPEAPATADTLVTPNAQATPDVGATPAAHATPVTSNASAERSAGDNPAGTADATPVRSDAAPGPVDPDATAPERVEPGAAAPERTCRTAATPEQTGPRAATPEQTGPDAPAPSRPAGSDHPDRVDESSSHTARPVESSSRVTDGGRPERTAPEPADATTRFVEPVLGSATAAFPSIGSAPASHPDRWAPTSTLSFHPDLDDDGDGLDAVAAPVRIPGRRRRRRRRGGKMLLAAGGATAVLAAGTGATAAWRAVDDSAPAPSPARSPSVPPVAAPQPAAPPTVPADLPPAAVLPGSTLGILPPSATAAPNPAPQRSATRTPVRPAPGDDARRAGAAVRPAPAPPRRTADPAPVDAGPGGGARARPPDRSPSGRSPSAQAPATPPPAAPAPAAPDAEPPPRAQGRRDPAPAPRPEIRYR